MLAQMVGGWPMKTCHQEANGLLNKANCILMYVLELLAAYHALQIYCKNMFDTSVHLKADSTTAVAWINKQTAPNELEFLTVKQIWNFTAQRKLEIYASYFESKKNKIADFESRNVKDNLQWALKDHIFTKVKIKVTYYRLICIQGKQ